MKSATLVSHYAPRDRARAKLVQSIQTPLVFVVCLVLGGISSHQFCSWVSL